MHKHSALFSDQNLFLILLCRLHTGWVQPCPFLTGVVVLMQRMLTPPTPHPPHYSPAGGKPLVVSDPAGPVGQQFMELGAAVVREVAKMTARPPRRVYFDEHQDAIVVAVPGSEELLLQPAAVRRNDTSAASIDEWTGLRASPGGDVPDCIKPSSISPLGNYAVQISWEDGFNQVASFELLDGLRAMGKPRRQGVAAELAGGLQATADLHV